jgi:hypothetical protein
MSSLFVMLKMEQAFGKTFVGPDEIDNENYRPEIHTIFGVRDLHIETVRSGEEPVYKARYERVISSGEELAEYEVEETLYLKYINDHWYITKSERIIVDTR